MVYQTFQHVAKSGTTGPILCARVILFLTGSTLTGHIQKHARAPMTRKDFQLIADVLKNNIELAAPDSKGLVRAIALDFAQELQKTNPRFNVQRFVKACEG